MIHRGATHDNELTYYIKVTVTIFFIGLLVFVLAYGAFLIFVTRNQSKIELPPELKGLFRSDRWLDASAYLAICS